jgi:hypothetical protein
MRAATLTYAPGGGWEFADAPVSDPDVVLWFAAPVLARNPSLYEGLCACFPGALITGCSTGGEIHNDEVLDGTAVAAAIRFERTVVRVSRSMFLLSGIPR